MVDKGGTWKKKRTYREEEDCGRENNVQAFDNEATQKSFDDFMISLSKVVRKTLVNVLFSDTPIENCACSSSAGSSIYNRFF